MYRKYITHTKISTKNVIWFLKCTIHHCTSLSNIPCAPTNSNNTNELQKLQV